MTTNLRFYLDFYPASAAEESDSEPELSVTGDSMRELYVALATHLGVLEVIPTYIDYDAESDETRYSIASLASQDHTRGVAVIFSEEV